MAYGNCVYGEVHDDGLRVKKQKIRFSFSTFPSAKQQSKVLGRVFSACFFSAVFNMVNEHCVHTSSMSSTYQSTSSVRSKALFPFSLDIGA